MRKRTDWSRPLPQSLVIPGPMTLATLADVRTLLGHLPVEHREQENWRYVATKPMRPRAAHRWLKYSRCCGPCWRWMGFRTDRNSDATAGMIEP